jgi:hypothetical protein
MPPQQPYWQAHPPTHLRVLGWLQLDDQLHAVDVQPARRHVCGHQHVKLAAAEPRQRHLALRLGDVAVQGARPDALAQQAGQLVGVVLGLRENDGAAAHACKGGGKGGGAWV